MLRVGLTQCPYCRRADIYISHPKDFWEEIAILLLLRPVRCHDCMRRFLRPLFVSTPVALHGINSRKSAQPFPAKEKQHKRSA